jgi:serine protease Do
MRQHRSGRGAARWSSICVALLLAACSDGTFAQRDEPSNDAPPAARRGAAALPDFAPLVESYGDAVVSVDVVKRRAQSLRQIPPDDPMLDFFRRFGIPFPDFGAPRNFGPMRGSGSGFIVSQDGYVLTNAHVAGDAEEVTVRLTDRREFEAKVIGSDARTDVAVLKIDAENLPVVRIGDPNELKPGQWVLAIGSPFGLANSATAGIVSATSRAVGNESYVPFIQTDVAVNPGNSGGPLFNLDGEVVGINSMIFSRTGGYMGLSFAIPIDVAMNVRRQLVDTGRVVRGRIGVMVQDVDARLAESFGLERPRGALVSSVEEDCPAANAGVQPGDVSLAVNGRDIDRFGDLSAAISHMKPGSEAKLQIWRDRKQRELNVRVAKLEQAVAGNTGAAAGGGQEQLGLAVRPLTSEEKQRSGAAAGLRVEAVTGPAASAGVRPGDIVVGVNGRSVDTVRQLRDAVASAGETAALLIRRNGAQIFIAVPTR